METVAPDSLEIDIQDGGNKDYECFVGSLFKRVVDGSSGAPHLARGYTCHIVLSCVFALCCNPCAIAAFGKAVTARALSREGNPDGAENAARCYYSLVL